ncbi:transposase [Kitasatospora sp. NPDC017646]|uniref:transposase n=1 Tax=Kitasatospora sp. NPDC017646 TaxID=3364024 RepID=UPI0037AFD01C
MAAAGQASVVINGAATESWGRELEELFLRFGVHFGRVEPRRRISDYVRGPVGPVGRKNGWQLAEYAGHATPDGLQHLLAGARWNADGIRDELQQYVAERLGEPGNVLILDDTGCARHEALRIPDRIGAWRWRRPSPRPCAQASRCRARRSRRCGTGASTCSTSPGSTPPSL